MTIQTSKDRFQRYWFVDGGWPTDDQGKADFAAVMQAMTDYGTDSNAIDLPRLLRLPGTYHVKREPLLVTIVEANGQRFTRQAILKAFTPNTVESSPARAREIEAFSDQDLKRAEEAIKFIPADAYAIWRLVGMALHHATSGNIDGFRLWTNWSESAPNKFDLSEQSRQWKSFKLNKANPVTLASVFDLAAQHGWEECQRRSKDASAGRSKSTSMVLARRPPNWGPFRYASGWVG